MFEGLSLEEFYEKFRCEEDCAQYLFSIKWKKGFVCKRCAHHQAWKGKTAFHLRCQKCGYDESVTANTAFHKVKIPLLKAFGLVFQMSVPKKGKSCNDLRKEFSINPKTALAFRRKAREVMESTVSGGEEIACESNLVVDSITVTDRGKGLGGFQRVSLNMKKISIKRKKAKFFLAGKCFPGTGEVDYSQLIGGKFKGENPRLLLWRFKQWLTGIHHHCSIKYIDGYLAEFLFRHNYRTQVKQIWHLLIEQFIQFNPAKQKATAT